MSFKGSCLTLMLRLSQPLQLLVSGSFTDLHDPWPRREIRSHQVIFIGCKAFQDCSALSSLSLQGSGLRVSDFAFTGCGSDLLPRLPGRRSTWDWGRIRSTIDLYSLISKNCGFGFCMLLPRNECTNQPGQSCATVFGGERVALFGWESHLDMETPDCHG